MQDVERVKKYRWALLAHVICLQELEGRAAFFIQGDNLAVKDGILSVQIRDRFHDLRELCAEIFFISG